MGTGYTRNDVSNNIADGNIINASDLDGEFDAVESAFNSSTGHTHDGTAAEGGAITVVGPVQDLVVSATEVKPKTTNTLDLGTSGLLYKDAYLQGNMYFRDTALKIVSSADGQLDIDADVELELVAPTVDIDASTALTVDTASTTFTSTLFNVTGSANITGDLDVDNININGNTIISTDTNGAINITPNGTGAVNITATTNITGDLDVDNININGNTIISTDTNGDINISPDGTGTVVIDTDLDVDNINVNGNTVSSTDTNGDINLSPNGTGTVVINTDLDVDNININGNTISSTDTNGNLTIDPNGTGNIVLDANVGIGTSSPATALHVKGGTNENVMIVDATGTAANYIFDVRDDGTSKFRVDPSGNVGIGVTSMTNKLVLPNAAYFAMQDTAGAESLAIRANASNAMEFLTGGSERMRIDSSGNVGIANSSPTSKLTIGSSSIAAGTGLFQQIQTAGNNMYVGIGSNNSAYIQANGEFRIATGGYADKVIVDSSGNVGIGTSSPTAPLTVYNASNPYASFADAANYFNVGVITSNYGLVNSSLPISFQISDSEKMRIDSSGNLGVGTSSPNEKVTINGSFRAASQDWQMQILNPDTAAANKGGGIAFGGSYTGTTQTYFSNILGAKENGTAGNLAGYLSFYTRLSGEGYTAERMRIDSSGNVGIGTVSPHSGSKLHILAAGTTQLRLDSSGAATGDGSFIRLMKGGTDIAYIGVAGTILGSTSNDTMFYAEGANNMRFSTNGAERMRISSNGNVLFGCTAFPSASVAGFTINGTSSGNASSSGASTAAYNHLLFYNGNGLVGYISTSGSTTSFANVSDYRLKTAVNYDWDATTRLKQLRPARFEWIADGDDAVPVDGFLAHEVQDVVPEAISGTKDAMRDEEYQVSAATGDIYTPAIDAVLDEDGNEATPAVAEVIHSADVERPEELTEGQQWRETTAAVMGTRSVPDYQGIDQSKLTPLLTKALIEAVEKIEALEARIAALEAN
jgi:cytoskeletal protein CcmA (bactofilin family)